MLKYLDLKLVILQLVATLNYASFYDIRYLDPFAQKHQDECQQWLLSLSFPPPVSASQRWWPIPPRIDFWTRAPFLYPHVCFLSPTGAWQWCHKCRSEAWVYLLALLRSWPISRTSAMWWRWRCWFTWTYYIRVIVRGVAYHTLVVQALIRPKFTKACV